VSKFLGIILCIFSFSCSNDSSPSKDQSKAFKKSSPLKDSSLNASVHKIQQLNRPWLKESIRIPKQPEFSDEFLQADESVMKIDILIVVDNSGSMYEEQANLSTKLAPLLSGIEDTDWQIGIINTEWPCFLDPALPYNAFTPDLANKFSRSIRQGTSGAYEEKAMKMAGLHITQTPYESEDTYATNYGESCTAKEWLRKDAAFAMLILADEDEDPTSDWTPQRFFDALIEVGYTPGENAQVNGIIWRPGTICPAGYTQGIKHAHLIGMTGGIMGDICAEDYTQALNGISANFRDMVMQDFALRMIPLHHTVEITIDDQPFYGEYTVVGHRLIFRNAIPKGSRIRVKYRTDEVRSVSIKEDADAKSLELELDDTPIRSDDFVYDEEKKLIRFLEPLKEDTTLHIRYRRAGTLLREFSFPAPIDAQSVECYHNEVLIPVRYIPERGAIRFAAPIPDDEEAICLYY
jgi:hypothetical protein